MWDYSAAQESTTTFFLENLEIIKTNIVSHSHWRILLISYQLKAAIIDYALDILLAPQQAEKYTSDTLLNCCG